MTVVPLARTAFISSRMEELAPERHSAFHAIYSAGLIPLMFEMEPVQDIKPQIDGLVDSADLFVGIYFQTIGIPKTDLGTMGPQKRFRHDLCPIEYELYRFITRHWLHPAVGRKPSPLTDSQRKEISQRMRDRSHIRKLRELLHRPDAVIAKLLDERILLFQLRRRGESYISRRLADFLPRPPAITRFSTHVVKSTQHVKEKRYFPPHISLYTALTERLRALVHKRKIGVDCGPLLPDQEFDVRVEGRDRPGILYEMLCALQMCGLNMNQIAVTKNGKEVEVLAAVAPYYGRLLAEERRGLLATTSNRLKEKFCQLTVEVNKELKPRFAPRAQRSPYEYAIRAANLPGLAKAICELIVDWGGNIEFIGYNSHVADGLKGDGSVTGKYHQGVFGISPVGSSPKLATLGGRMEFEYRVRSLIGVLDVEELGRERPQAIERTPSPSKGIRAPELKKRGMPAYS
jgi:uncharacterized protein DUF4062